jgi:hypothetical protein
VELTPSIAVSAARRLAVIRRDLQHAWEHYLREEVRAALAYWKVVETA